MDCLEPPPTIFRILSHAIHVFSFPTYAIALIALFLIKSKVFTTYRLFLIWHVFENLCFELSAAFLIQPAVHPPYPLIRTTGLLAQWGISGLLQFYFVSVGIEYNGISINEMFYFRYKASLFNYKDRRFTYFLRACIYSARFIALFDPAFSALTYADATDFQLAQKQHALHLNPSSTFLLCSSVFLIAPFTDYISTVLPICWLIQTAMPAFIVPGVAIYVNRNVEKSQSAVTWKIQQQLLRSLSIQAFIHGIMLGIPNYMFLYAFFFGYENENYGYIAFLAMTYHGFVSTFAMIVFTKPLRSYISQSMGCHGKMSTKVSVSNRTSATT